MTMRSRVFATIVSATLTLVFATTIQAQWPKYPTKRMPRRPDGSLNVTAPPPHANGKPDLSGVWLSTDTGLFFDLAKDLPATDVVMTPWASGVQKQREGRDHVDDPLAYCLPPGVPRIDTINPIKIVQTPDVTVFLHELTTGSTFRQVFTDGRPIPQGVEPAWLGYAVGRWEGDTFVVESAGFRDRGWLDTRKARPHSDALRVTERFTRLDVGRMSLRVTIDDPKTYVKPWTVSMTLKLIPDSELIEATCEGQQQHSQHYRFDPPPPEPPSPPVPSAK